MYVVSTFYKFVDLEDYRALRVPLLTFCKERGAKGSILLATEGINATIVGTVDAIDAILGYLREDARLADLTDKRSYCEFIPFKRMKVRLKREIVHLGMPAADPRVAVGTYVDAHEWNALISDPEVLVIDTRNDYEVQVGTFRGAINPHTGAFDEFPAYVANHLDPQQHKKVAMFCTGGIRCEKATSYMLQNGFSEVYHLKGGILRYLEAVSADDSLWQGECFVFDDRVAVDHDLQPGQAFICDTCHQVVPADGHCLCADASQ